MTFRVVRTASSLLCLTAALAPSAAAADRALTDVLSNDALLVATVDVERIFNDYTSLDLVRLFHDPEVQDFLAPAVEALTAEREWREMSAVCFLLQSYGLPEIIGGEVSLALLGAGIPSQQGIAWYSASNPPPAAALEREPDFVLPDLVVHIQTSGRPAFESSLNRALELDPDIETQAASHGDFHYSITSIPIDGFPLPVYHGFVGDSFVLTLRPERLHEVAAAFGKDGASGAFAANDAFKRCRAASHRGTEILDIYVAASTIKNAVWPYLDEWDRKEVEGTGVEDIRAIGVSIGMEDGRLRDNLTVVLPEKRPGVFKIFDAFRPGGDIAGDIAGDSHAALAARVDAAQLVDLVIGFIDSVEPGARAEADRELAQAKEEMGFDIREDWLKSLGSSLHIAAKMPRSGFIPDVTGSVAVRDATKLASCIDRLKAIATQESRGQLSFADLDLGDNQGFYMKIEDAPVSPAFMIADDRLTFALAPNTLKRLARSGPSDETLSSDNDDFGRCVATSVGQKMSDTVGMLYLDIAKGAEFGLGMAGTFLPMLNGELPFQFDPALFPMPETVADYLSGSLTTLRVGKDYLALDSSYAIGGLLLPIAASAVAAETIGRQSYVMVEPPQPVIDPNRAFLGVNYEPSSDHSRGIHITTVIEGAPASQAGLLDGDVITAVDDVKILSAEAFSNALSGRKAGDQVVVEVARGAETHTIPIVLGRRGDYVD